MGTPFGSPESSPPGGRPPAEGYATPSPGDPSLPFAGQPAPWRRRTVGIGTLALYVLSVLGYIAIQVTAPDDTGTGMLPPG